MGPVEIQHFDEMEEIKINGRGGNWSNINKMGVGGVKQKDFFLVVMIQPSIIKQLEQMSTSLKHLKMCLSANVSFAESC